MSGVHIGIATVLIHERDTFEPSLNGTDDICIRSVGLFTHGKALLEINLAPLQLETTDDLLP